MALPDRGPPGPHHESWAGLAARGPHDL